MMKSPLFQCSCRYRECQRASSSELPMTPLPHTIKVEAKSLRHVMATLWYLLPIKQPQSSSPRNSISHNSHTVHHAMDTLSSLASPPPVWKFGNTKLKTLQSPSFGTVHIMYVLQQTRPEARNAGRVSSSSKSFHPLLSVNNFLPIN